MTTGRLSGKPAARRLAGLLRRLRQDQRGVAAAVFGVSAVAFLGIVGLAVEGGTWYLDHRKGQNAADAAAMAGATALAWTQGATVARASGINTAQMNGYTSGGVTTVTVNTPPSSGAYATGANASYAVEAIIQQSQSPYFARLFGINSLSIRNRAVAVMVSKGQPCVLALSNQLQAGGNDTITGPNCVLASNSNNATRAINIYGSSSLNVYSLRSVGGCNNCSSNRVTAVRPYSANVAPMSNPFAPLDTWAMPTLTDSNCIAIPAAVSGVVTLSPFNSSDPKAYCNGGSPLRTQNGDTVNFQPGTYFFRNMGLRFDGGTIQCPSCASGNTAGPGVNIILVGDSGQIGGIIINAQADMTLNAQTTGTLNSALNGVLFYRQEGSGGNIRINGGADTWWRGGMYYPGQDILINGNATNSPADCTVVVAAGIDLTGNSNNFFDNTGCPGMGIDSAPNRQAQLVE